MTRHAILGLAGTRWIWIDDAISAIAVPNVPYANIDIPTGGMSWPVVAWTAPDPPRSNKWADNPLCVKNANAKPKPKRR